MSRIKSSTLTASIFAVAVLGTFSVAQAETRTAIFAGGCFWCIEKDFEKVAGVIDVVSGYTGGESDNPTYKSHVKENHLEAVRITYDSDKVSYESLLETFWRTVDPTDPGGQFCDRGNSYTTAVFALDDMQRELAEKTRAEAEAVLGKKIVTPVRDAAPFYEAEGYHQDYYKKNPVRYTYYRTACGRNSRVKALWGEEAYRGVGGHSS